MRYIHKWIKEDFIYLIPIGDLHLGSPASRKKELKKLIESADRRTFFILLGDILDNAIIESLGNVYEQELNPQNALEEIIELLKPVKDRILGAVSGNHEERTRRRVGIDVMKIISQALCIDYENDIFVFDISVGENASRGSARRVNYSIVVGHGYTGARTLGGKITANGRIIDVVIGADIYITAHTHQPSVVPFARFEIDPHNKKLFKRNGYLITIPAWQDYENYAARKFMHPNANSFLTIKLSGKTKNIEVIVR